MDPRLTPLAAIFELNTDLLLNCLEGLSQGDAQRRLDGGGNSIIFLAAHLADTRHFLLGRLGHPLANPLSRYLADAQSIEDIGEWPTLEEVRRAWLAVSARLSERSVTRYARFGQGLRRLVAGLAAVLCQTDADARRWLAIGADPARLAVVGNLKDDALPEPAADPAASRRLQGLDPERPLLVLGSLRPGEARVLARAWASVPDRLRAQWQVVAVPRHPSASDELRAEASRAGQRVVDEGLPDDGACRWDDRTGVLRDWYGAAEVAVVGGTIGPYGGHNPLEPAAAGAAVVIGPHHTSQRDAVEALRARGAVVIADGEAALGEALTALLGDPGRREVVARDGLAVVRARRGAVLRTVRELAARDLWPVA